MCDHGEAALSIGIDTCLERPRPTCSIISTDHRVRYTWVTKTGCRCPCGSTETEAATGACEPQG